MKTTYSYTPSKLLPGEGELLRQHSFTRWMSRDLHQASIGFLKSLGPLPLYIESSPEKLLRSIQWHPPEGCGFEIRSGRAFAQFEEYDRGNLDRKWALLSLHVNEGELYSAVWIAEEHLETARKVLAMYGITPAMRTVSA